MADRLLRELERIYQITGSTDDYIQYLRAVVRSGYVEEDFRLGQQSFRFFQKEPSRELLVLLLTLLHREARLTNDILEEILHIWPYSIEFTGRLWPGISDRVANLFHRDLVSLVSRIHPRQRLIEMFATWSNLDDILTIVNVIRRQLLEVQLSRIVGLFESQGDHREDMRLASSRGLAQFPEIIWLDWTTPWTRSKFGYFPDKPDPIATVIMEGDYIALMLSGSLAAETVQTAYRYAIGLDMEPGSGIWWSSRWAVDSKFGVNRWDGDKEKGNFLLIPYREGLGAKLRDNNVLLRYLARLQKRKAVLQEKLTWEWFPGKRARLFASLRRIREKETEMLELAESENLISRREE